MFENCTVPARAAVRRATYESVLQGHDRVSVIHLTLGLLTDPAGAVSPLCATVDLSAVRTEAGRLGTACPCPADQLPMTGGLRRVLTDSVLWARTSGDRYVEEAHLLFAALADGAGDAARLLLAVGVTREAIRVELARERAQSLRIR